MLARRALALLLTLGLLACSLTACNGNEGSNQDPCATFSLTPDDPVATRMIQFTDESTDPDGAVTAWNWQFGNGDTSDEQNPAYAYPRPGTYDVTLTVTDGEGAASMDVTRAVPVAEAGPLRAAQDSAWTWIPVAGAKCRNGSATGLGVRVHSGSDDLFIYLQGGGACFSEETCATTPTRFDAGDFQDVVDARGEAGILDPKNSENPVADWNAVFVPYCTGDAHGGSAPNGAVPGVGAQQFVGHQNVELYLDALKTYFRDDLDKVLLTGESAGGGGTLFNFDDVAQHFGEAEAYLLDDSGPFFYDDTVLPPVLQSLLVNLWNLEGTFPPDADALLEPDGLANVYGYYADKYPGATFGLISHLQDAVIRRFFGVTGPISGAEYAAGLADLNQRAPTAWGTYYAPSDAHTFLGGQRLYTTTVAGVPLTDWLDDLLSGQVSDVTPDDASPAASPPHR